MSDTVEITFDDAFALSMAVLTANGFSEEHAQSIANVVCICQRDECYSHGLYRLLVCVNSIRSGKVDGRALPNVVDHAQAIVKVDSRMGYSLLGLDAGMPVLLEKAEACGIAAMAINNCFHFSALWPEVERIAAAGMVGLAMNPSHSWVAPAGGTAALFGTNPLAFGWPRENGDPLVFDFATSAVARGEIELYRRAGTRLPDNVAIDTSGHPTNDPDAALAGAMLPFGGHKGSALSLMIELLAGPLIGDLTSRESLAADDGAGATPVHGELLIAFSPKRFIGADFSHHWARAEALFDAVELQGARLPSKRRYTARVRSLDKGTVSVDRALLDDLKALLDLNREYVGSRVREFEQEQKSDRVE